jgi:hypothetical protein
MAKREINYGNLAVIKNDSPEPEQQETVSPVAAKPELTAREGEYLKDVAQSILLYVSPEAHKQLLMYSVQQSSHRNRVRVHDCIIEALENWFREKGLAGPVRAKERVKPGQGARRR